LGLSKDQGSQALFSNNNRESDYGNQEGTGDSNKANGGRGGQQARHGQYNRACTFALLRFGATNEDQDYVLVETRAVP
jgi:hypothetical protein